MPIEIIRPCWKCDACGASFEYEDYAIEHEEYSCPVLVPAWDSSPLNPDNEKCATCVHSASFLNLDGRYEPSRATSECPQRLIKEAGRSFPCPAYARDTKTPTGYDFEHIELSDISRRYLRSFGISA